MSTLNYVAQLRLRPGGALPGRFVIDSTLGTRRAARRRHGDEDSQRPHRLRCDACSLGMHPGPYFVIPLLGPNTVRDGVGWGWTSAPATSSMSPTSTRAPLAWYLLPVGLLDQRASVDYRYYATASALRVRQHPLPVRAQDPDRGMMPYACGIAAVTLMPKLQPANEIAGTGRAGARAVRLLAALR